MRDFVWTIIVIWLIYKLVDIFRGSSKKKFDSQGDAQSGESARTNAASQSEKDIKSAVQKHLNNEGEYVDFEEMK